MDDEAEKQRPPRHDSRRAFLATAGAGTLLLSTCVSPSQAAHPVTPLAQFESKVSVNEDLMREHGVLDRLLLIYEAARAQLVGGNGFHPQPLHRAAGIVQRFIEQYHEKLEEDHVFPCFERVGQLTDLVSVLRQQHAAGRKITESVRWHTTPGWAPTNGKNLTRAIDAFIRMYRPHAAREDTILFPALRHIVSPSELAVLGEKFEEIEQERFGEGGFAAVVEEVAELERTLEIHDLSRFTAKG